MRRSPVASRAASRGVRRRTTSDGRRRLSPAAPGRARSGMPIAPRRGRRALDALRVQTVGPDVTVSTARPVASTATSRAQTMGHENRAFDGDVAGGPVTGAERALRGGVDFALVGERAVPKPAGTRPRGTPPVWGACRWRCRMTAHRPAHGSPTHQNSPPASDPTTATTTTSRDQRPGSRTIRLADTPWPGAPCPASATSRSVVAPDSMWKGGSSPTCPVSHEATSPVGVSCCGRLPKAHAGAWSSGTSRSLAVTHALARPQADAGSAGALDPVEPDSAERRHDMCRVPGHG